MKRLVMNYGFELEFRFPSGNEEKLDPLITLGDLGSDNSIHCEDGQRALELRSYVRNKKQILLLADSICDILKYAEASVDKSCGYHLHVSNKAFFIRKNINRIVFLWCAIEDILISTQPQSRYNNRYCLRKLLDLLEDIEYDLPTKKDEIINLMMNKNRYFALNLAALYKHRTIEIRLHSGTIKADKIKMWIELMTAFFNYAVCNYNHQEVTEVFNMKISKEKIERVFKLLRLKPKIANHFAKRIRKFGFERLGQEQEVAIEFLKELPSFRKKKKLIERMDKKLDEDRRKLQKIRNKFNRNNTRTIRNPWDAEGLTMASVGEIRITQRQSHPITGEEITY